MQAECLAKHLNNMALQLFVDPNEGARAYARGIEKAFDSIGDAAGGILQSYNDARVKKQQLLGTLAAYDHDNVKGQKEYLVQQNDKDRQNVLLGHYERKYETLASMEGALQGVAIEKEKQDRNYEQQVREQTLKLNQANIDRQTQLVAAGDAAVERAKQLLSSDTPFKFSGNLMEDQSGAFADIREAQSLVTRFPDLPGMQGLKKAVDVALTSPEYASFGTRMKAKQEQMEVSRQLVPLYNTTYAKEIAEGKMQPVDARKLQEEIYSDQVDSPELMKVRAGNYASTMEKYLMSTESPGFMLEIMDVPSVANLKAQGRMPSIQEMRALERFDKRFQAGDLSLFEGVTDTRSAMLLSRMNVDPKTGKPNMISESDEEEINSLVDASRGIKDVLSMLGSKDQEDYIIAGRKISVADSNRLRTSWNDLKGALSPTGQQDTDTVAFRSRIASMVTGIARGVFGEVGVLTDADIERYQALLADPKNPADLNIVLSEMLMDTVRKKADTLFTSLASSGKNVSGLIPIYNEIQPSFKVPFASALSRLQQGKVTAGESMIIEDPETGENHRISVTNPERLMSDLSEEADRMKANLRISSPSSPPALPSTEMFSDMQDEEQKLPAYLTNKGGGNRRLFGGPTNRAPMMFLPTRRGNQGYMQPSRQLLQKQISGWTRTQQ